MDRHRTVRPSPPWPASRSRAPRPAKMVGVEFDYIVVGAGAAGCVLAGRLAAARPRLSVLLIEYGGRAVNPLLHIPKGFYYTLRGDRYLYRYRDAPGHAGRRGRGLAARPGARRVGGGERDDVDARRPGRLGRAGGARQSGLVLGGRAARVQGDGEPQPRPARDSAARADRSGSRSPTPRDQVTAAILASAVSYGWEHVERRQRRPTPSGSPSPRPRSGDGRRTTSYDAYVRPALADGRRRGAAATSPSPPAPGSAACSSTAAAAVGCGSAISAGTRGTSRPAGR